jgi:hypothetical protein
MWYRSVITDKTIPANRPDIIVTDHVNKYTYLIDIAVPGTTNHEKTDQEKINKYTELADEIRRIWNHEEVKIIPLLVSATGIVPKNLFNSLKETVLPQSVYIYYILIYNYFQTGTTTASTRGNGVMKGCQALIITRWLVITKLRKDFNFRFNVCYII